MLIDAFLVCMVVIAILFAISIRREYEKQERIYKEKSTKINSLSFIDTSFSKSNGKLAKNFNLTEETFDLLEQIIEETKEKK